MVRAIKWIVGLAIVSVVGTIVFVRALKADRTRKLDPALVAKIESMGLELDANRETIAELRAELAKTAEAEAKKTELPKSVVTLNEIPVAMRGSWTVDGGGCAAGATAELTSKTVKVSGCGWGPSQPVVVDKVSGKAPLYALGGKVTDDGGSLEADILVHIKNEGEMSWMCATPTVKGDCAWAGTWTRAN